MKKYRIYNAKYKNRIAQFYEILHSAVDDNKGLLADVYYNEFRGYLEGLLYGNVITVNKIPRVYVNTGIEYKVIVDFVTEIQQHDDRVIIIKPVLNIKDTLREYGYPFKSKGHSAILDRYQRTGLVTSVKQYLGIREDKEPWSSDKSCPNILKYQFTSDFKIHISDKCCTYLKENPIKKWAQDNNKPYSIVGIMASEGGRRSTAVCLAFKKGKLKAFQPLAPLNKEWENWFIEKHNIKLCKLYYPPYNFNRTGCKGCPFATRLQDELDTLEKYFPAERKQCEYIWKPVYDEYRRINYRLKKEVNNGQQNNTN